MRNKISVPALVFIAIAVLTMIMGGCANIKHAPLEIHYYTLEYDPPRPVENNPLPYTVKIEQFQSSPLYDSNRIIFKKEDFTRDEYTYHKWCANPGELVSFYLARDFSDTGRFQAALSYESTLPYSHLITGVVEDFYLQKGDTSEAVLTIAVNLVESKRSSQANAILMQKKYRLGIESQAGNPQGFAKAMSTAMQQVSANILRDVAAIIEKK